MDWTHAGAGTIPTNRTQCGATIAAYTGDAGIINTAIAACPQNQFVKLAAGTFNLSTGIRIGVPNVTLRGAGSDQTFLVFSGQDSCGGKTAFICIGGLGHYPESPGNTANWTAGYARGATSITLDSATNLSVGSTLVLDQIYDTGDADPGNDVYVCTSHPLCIVTGGYTPPGRAGGRAQIQFVTVTSISGSGPFTIGIAPGLYMPNWRSAKSPGAYWKTQQYLNGNGVEDLSVDLAGNTFPPFNIAFFNSQYSWVARVRSSFTGGKHVLFFMSHHITVRDSYLFGAHNPVNDAYGVDCFICGDDLIENNIMQLYEVPMMNEVSSTGNVWGYNFSIHNLFCAAPCSQGQDWMQASLHDHGTGNSWSLSEGNDVNGIIHENYFGVAHFFTHFRNRVEGWEAWVPLVTPGNGPNETVVVHNQGMARFHNYVGNVFGHSGFHTTYEDNATGPTTSSSGQCTHAIYGIGMGGNCAPGDGSTFPLNDLNTLPSLMRWGNYDTVNGANRFVASEVPSGIAHYANAVPGNTTLPNSFYLAARPDQWWKVNNIIPPWPPIGPDVTTGTIANLNGHAARIPARICFEDIMGGTFNDTTARTFNATTCYTAASGVGPQPPGPPTNFTIAGF